MAALPRSALLSYESARTDRVVGAARSVLVLCGSGGARRERLLSREPSTLSLGCLLLRCEAVA